MKNINKNIARISILTYTRKYVFKRPAPTYDLPERFSLKKIVFSYLAKE